MAASAPSPKAPLLREALRACRPHFVAAATFSAVSNILYLAPSIYMMQVYDRVIPSGGLMTLVVLSVIGVAVLGALSLLDLLRTRLLVRASARFDSVLAGPALQLLATHPRLTRVERTDGMHHFDTFRQAIAGQAIPALLDLPWTPIYVIVAAMLHPLLGLLTLVSSIVLITLAWHNERATAAPMRVASQASSMAYARQGHAVSHSFEVRALGMAGALATRQLEDRAEANGLQLQASFAAGNHGAIIKFLRLVLQSAALGVGAVLVIDGSLSAGVMFAASLLLSRALAPIEQLVGAWRSLQAARASHAALTAIFADKPARMHTFLPAPTGAIVVDTLTLPTPAGDRVAIADVSFSVDAGAVIGVVGQSGAGKSSLLRAITGADAPLRGTIRFDGAALTDWNQEELARHIGYVPQSFVLFAGSVKDNIASFRASEGGQRERDAAVIEAATACFAHDMIVRLPNGYDTVVGPGGYGLSAGQMQRIALARAMFGRPKILLLDEPTAHLDPDAQHAFIRTLSSLRSEKTTVLLASHNADVLASVDKMLVMQDGRIVRFGPVADFMEKRTPVSHIPEKAA